MVGWRGHAQRKRQARRRGSTTTLPSRQPQTAPRWWRSCLVTRLSPSGDVGTLALSSAHARQHPIPSQMDGPSADPSGLVGGHSRRAEPRVGQPARHPGLSPIQLCEDGQGVPRHLHARRAEPLRSDHFIRGGMGGGPGHGSRVAKGTPGYSGGDSQHGGRSYPRVLTIYRSPKRRGNGRRVRQFPAAHGEAADRYPLPHPSGRSAHGHRGVVAGRLDLVIRFFSRPALVRLRRHHESGIVVRRRRHLPSGGERAVRWRASLSGCWDARGGGNPGQCA